MDAFEQDLNTLWSLLFAVVIDAEKRVQAHVAAHDLTPPQFFVLKTLTEHGGHCSIGQIAREHHLTGATMTGLIKRMESMSLVMREPDPEDRRSVMVVMTAAGEERFRAVQEDLMAQVRVVLGLLTPASRQELIDYLSQYVRIVAEQFPIGE